MHNISLLKEMIYLSFYVDRAVAYLTDLWLHPVVQFLRNVMQRAQEDFNSCILRPDLELMATISVFICMF